MISECSKLAQKDYKIIHKKDGSLRITQEIEFGKLETVVENEMDKIFLEFFKTYGSSNHGLRARRCVN